MLSHKYLPIFDIKSIGKYIERKTKLIINFIYIELI